MSTMWSMCSMSTGHCSTQAPQVVHDHSTSGSITPSDSASPTSGRVACSGEPAGTRPAPDSKVSALMLQVARELRVAEPETPAGPRPGSAGTGGAHSRGVPSAALSEREREVARLLLLGMPYRDIGAQLFISAKTVEHHVARIRRRIGAQSRSELLSMLRAALGPEAIAAP